MSAETVADIADLYRRLGEALERYRPDLTPDELTVLRNDVSGIRKALSLDRTTVELYAGADITDGEVFVRAMLWRAETRRDFVDADGDARRLVEAIDEVLAGAYRERTHLVLRGDTLEALALQYLGDAGLFWRIAEANDIDPSADLATSPGVGTKIRIPEA